MGKDCEESIPQAMEEKILKHLYLKDGNELTISEFPKNGALGVKVVHEQFGIEQIVFYRQDLSVVISALSSI